LINRQQVAHQPPQLEAEPASTAVSKREKAKEYATRVPSANRPLNPRPADAPAHTDARARGGAMHAFATWLRPCPCRCRAASARHEQAGAVRRAA
jgi:hypothetical protein